VDGVAASRATEPGDALLLVDVLADFGHEDGESLLRSYRAALPALERLIGEARAGGVPIIYANDDFGTWSGDRGVVEAAAREGSPDPSIFDTVAPQRDDAFLCKPRYSAFDHTPLTILLAGKNTRRVLLAGTATEMCVAQTAIAAREYGYRVSVVAGACSSVDAENAALALRYLERVVGVRIC
jgi:nicotinamidase-related amidase